MTYKESDFCPECGHMVRHHAPDNDRDNLFCGEVTCLCKLTRDHLRQRVSSPDDSFSEAVKEASQPAGNAFPGFPAEYPAMLLDFCRQVAENPATVTYHEQQELELLVIDLGDSCVVKVEKGIFSLESEPCGTLYKGDTSMARRPFTELRKAIDGNIPLPRIEQATNNSAYVTLFLPLPMSEGLSLSQLEYDALSELAGKPLPIHKAGEWKQFPVASEKTFNDTGVAIWRYRRGK